MHAQRWRRVGALGVVDLLERVRGLAQREGLVQAVALVDDGGEIERRRGECEAAELVEGETAG